MPRELDLLGVYVPSLLAVLLLSVALFWVLDGVIARSGVYRWVWHIDLFRLALFVIMFATLGNCLYR